MSESALKNGPETEKPVKEGTAGFSSCAVNLLKSILGSGMLALPAAIGKVGLIPALLLLTIASILSVAGLQLLVMACERTTSKGMAPIRETNFAALAKHTYPKSSLLFEGSVAVKCILVAGSYLTVVGDVLPALIQSIFPNCPAFLSSRFFLVSLVVLIISPVTFFNRMDSLKYTSFLGLIGIAYLFVLSIIMFFGYNESAAQSLSNIDLFVPLTLASFQSFSVFVFALTCHQNLFPIYNEIKDNRPSVLFRLILMCILISFGMYVIFGASFLGVFGKEIKPNVISNFPQNGGQFIAARFLYTFLMIFSYPLQMFPARSSIIKVLGNLTDGRQNYFHIGITLIILAFSWLIACINLKLNVLLTIVGATTGPVICYFLPAMFWWKLNDEKRLNLGKLSCIALFIFGTLAIVIPLGSFITGYIV